MSVSIQFYDGVEIPPVGVTHTYLLAAWSDTDFTSRFYKIGRTKNLVGRLASLVQAFNDGQPRNQAWPIELLVPCPMQIFDACTHPCPDIDYVFRIEAIRLRRSRTRSTPANSQAIASRGRTQRLGTKTEWFWLDDDEFDQFAETFDGRAVA
jgi:hypothetical protein